MLKNYTSTVPASRSVAYIESKLVANGAQQILKHYTGDGKLDGIRFTLPVDGQDVLFSLPARVKNCERVLEANLSSRAQPATRKKIPEQAERTAWKILSDWIEAQMAMIELAQVEAMEVFLPYIYHPGSQQTFYELAKSKKFKALLPLSAAITEYPLACPRYWSMCHESISHSFSLS